MVVGVVGGRGEIDTDVVIGIVIFFSCVVKGRSELTISFGLRFVF